VEDIYKLDKKLYLIAELDNDTQKIIKKYEKIILENGFTGNQTKDIPYHITLGAYSIENENYLKDLLDKINSKFNEINITYSGFGLFQLDVLYLNPCMNKKLIEMYDFVLDKNIYKENNFAAHTTIFIDKPENILKLLPKFVENSEKINGKIKYISLFEFFPVKFIKRIELKE
jgi:2'-5' RNA ligase